MNDLTSLPTLLLIDGHSLAFRSYYAFAKGRDGGLRTSAGIPTNICFGFLKSLLQAIQVEKPEFLAIAFDTSAPTFRHQADPTYKADRKETPDDFIPDMKNLQALLQELNLTAIAKPGYEADDILGTLAVQGSQAGYRVKIMTGDRDLFQVVDDEKQISVIYLDPRAIKSARSGLKEFHATEVEEKLGVTPAQVIDYKALCGDKSDNIPGIRGIGEKTAVKLLKEYGTLEKTYENIEQIKGANQKKLKTGQEDAKHSQFMATIKLDVPLEIKVNDLKLEGLDFQQAQPLLEKLELNKLSQQLDKLQEQFGSNSTESTSLEIESSEDGDTSFFSAEETEKAQEEEKSLITPEIINTEAKLTALVDRLKTYTNPEIPVAWDTETSSLEPRDTELVGIGCCWGENLVDMAYIPLAHKEGKQLDKTLVLETLKPILESENYPKSLQNAKFDRLVLFYQGIKLKGVVFDTMLASYIINPDSFHNLTDLSLKYLTEIEAKSYKDLEIPKGKNISDLPVSQVAEYCGMDVYATFHLVPKLRAELTKIPALEELLLDIEQPLEPVLSAMEDQGIRIDTDYLKQLSEQLGKDLTNIEKNAYEEAGEEFNLGSPKQLSKLFFETLGLSTRKTRKTKTGYSTDHATLEKLQGDHPVIDRILEYRTLSKLKSTYVDAIPALVHLKTGRIHTHFNQTVTSTGRLSSSNPNLQNIPIRSEFSRQIRKAFLPREGWQLVSADYSQIELRILAHLSQEPILVEAYSNHQDVHRVTAQLLFEKEEITPDERRLGKTINFGVIYGMGAQRFAREAGVSSKEGKIFIDRYRERYANVFAYLERMKKEAIAFGYVETLLKRRRYFNFAGESVQKLQGLPLEAIDLEKLKNLSQGDAQLLRAAANAPIQGSSADIIKIAMIKLHEILQNYQAKLLLQVHDELVFEVPPEEWEELEPQIRDTMENAVKLSIPLVVDVSGGKNWMEAK
ncbi:MULTISPECIES: DNA polymerase I [Spirulina sp. CCY15215]|uniref:DNA polymerase I n=1 Tax=Spirulina sp. CCY15215 TaxID=2767591 RepID=UPI001EF36824|nr:DNA polymerase I [Spirulina major]